jgi:hypothetical protein
VGFNATRRYRDKKTVDIALLVAAIVIVIGLLAWVVSAGGS